MQSNCYINLKYKASLLKYSRKIICLRFHMLLRFLIIKSIFTFYLLAYQFQQQKIYLLIEQQQITDKINDLPIMQSSRQASNLSSLFRMIDINLSKFYSSRPQPSLDPGACQCSRFAKEKPEQVRFYKSQKQMIQQAGEKLVRQQRQEDQRVFGNILLMMVEFINKILQLLMVDPLCQCKKLAVGESLVMKHKIHFLREENEKFFRLFQQKNAECDQLLAQVKQLRRQPSIDFRPLSTKKLEAQLSIEKENNIISSLVYPKSMNLNEEIANSIRSSKISEDRERVNLNVKQLLQRDHNQYFIEQKLRKYRKNKIFGHEVMQQSNRDVLDYEHFS